MSEAYLAIGRFLEDSRAPALSEAGEQLLTLVPGGFAVERRNGAVFLQAWDERRNLVRKVMGVESLARGKLVLRVERFGKRSANIALLDMERPAAQTAGVRAGRLEFREQFRRLLRRQFPAFRVAELSAEPDLRHSLSPAYPRALLRQGSSAWAAIGAPSGGNVDGVLSFGLIWLDYLRRRETRISIQGLAVFVPEGRQKTTCLRVNFLNPDVARYAVFAYSPDGRLEQADPRDYGNLDTHLEPCRRRLPSAVDETIARLSGMAAVETLARGDGSLSLRVRGVEFARAEQDRMLCGLAARRPMALSRTGEAERLAEELGRVRSPEAALRLHPLYRSRPEAWLESQARAHLQDLDATLRPEPIYGQVPAFAAGDRGVLDLLAVDRTGRLAVIELKASEDIHLPLQALDYWMRVKWHLDRGEFSRNGYFPGMELRPEPPRLLLASPALEMHPTNETMLRFLASAIEVERIGVGVEWRKRLKVVFRA
jgi:hypothetical protein